MSETILTVRVVALSIAALSRANILGVPLYTFLRQEHIEVSDVTGYGVRKAAWTQVLVLACILEMLA